MRIAKLIVITLIAINMAVFVVADNSLYQILSFARMVLLALLLTFLNDRTEGH